MSPNEAAGGNWGNDIFTVLAVPIEKNSGNLFLQVGDQLLDRDLRNGGDRDEVVERRALLAGEPKRNGSLRDSDIVTKLLLGDIPLFAPSLDRMHAPDIASGNRLNAIPRAIVEPQKMTPGNAIGNVHCMPVRSRQRVDQPQQTEAERLRHFWDVRKQQLHLTQKEAAKAMGIKQTLVSHYLTGHKPLGVKALLRWAKFLQVSPTDIRPEFEHRDMMPGKLSPPQIEVAELWGRLPDAIAATFREQLRSTIKHLKQG